MFVCALVLAVGLAAVMGILYRNFDGQMRKELSKEAAYLAYGVEQQGVDYLKNIKDKSARITYIDQDGTVLFDNEADVSEMKITVTELSFRRQRNMVQENLRDIRIHFLRKPFIMHCV